MGCFLSFRNPNESGVMVTVANSPVDPDQVPYIVGFNGCLVQPNNAMTDNISSVLIIQR